MGNADKFSGNYTATEIETIIKKAITIAGFKTTDQNSHKTSVNKDRHIYSRIKDKTDTEIYTVYQKDDRKIALFNATRDNELPIYSENSEDWFTSLGAALSQFNDNKNNLTADELIIPIARQGGITHWSVLHIKRNENNQYHCVIYDPKTSNTANLHTQGNRYLEQKIKETFKPEPILRTAYLDQLKKEDININNPQENLSGLYTVENTISIILNEPITVNNPSKLKYKENQNKFKEKHGTIHDMEANHATETKIELLKTTENLEAFFAEIRRREIMAAEEAKLTHAKQNSELPSDGSDNSASFHSSRSSASFDSRSSTQSLTLNNSQITLTEVPDPETTLGGSATDSATTEDNLAALRSITLPPHIVQQQIVKSLIGDDSPRSNESIHTSKGVTTNAVQNNQEKTAFELIKEIQKDIIGTEDWSTKLGGNKVHYYKTKNGEKDFDSIRYADVPDGVKSILNAIRQAMNLIKENEGKYTQQDITEIYNDTFIEIQRIAAERLANSPFSCWFFKIRSDTTTKFYENIVNRIRPKLITQTPVARQLIKFN